MTQDYSKLRSMKMKNEQAITDTNIEGMEIEANVLEAKIAELVRAIKAVLIERGEMMATAES